MTIKSLSSPQIALIMKKGRAYSSGSFLLKTLPNTEIKETKGAVGAKLIFFCSFIASKKNFIKAVDRNRSKRRIKESFIEAVKEIGEDAFKNPLLQPIPQFVFLTKKDSMKNDFIDIVHDIKQILLKDYIIR
jgi:ribonuclease P protein component